MKLAACVLAWLADQMASMMSHGSGMPGLNFRHVAAEVAEALHGM